MAGTASRFEYVAWMRDPTLPADDEDYEWPAVFAIDAETADAAQAWGDHLALEYAHRVGNHFLHSTVEPLVGDTELPVVPDGFDADDQHIGW